jgi:hypothetical protein
VELWTIQVSDGPNRQIVIVHHVQLEIMELRQTITQTFLHLVSIHLKVTTNLSVNFAAFGTDCAACAHSDYK